MSKNRAIFQFQDKAYGVGDDRKYSSLRIKIIGLFLGIGIIPLLAAGLLSSFRIRAISKQVIGSSQKDLAIEVMDKIDREMHNALLMVRNWISMPDFLNIVATGEQQAFDQLEIEWNRDGLTSNSGAILLKKLQSTTQNRFKEIFVTDSRGCVIAATNKTSDFDQGHGDNPPFGEQWWAAAIGKGEHIGEVYYDESAGVYSVDIDMNILDDGTTVGIIKTVYNMENIQNLIGAVSKGERWHYELLNRNKIVVATRKTEKERILRAGPSVKILEPFSESIDAERGFAIGENELKKK